MDKVVFSILVENSSGVLSRVAGLFTRRGYNIDSIAAGVTADPKFTRITVVARGDETILEQIEKQLNKLEDVVDIKKLMPDSRYRRRVRAGRQKLRQGRILRRASFRRQGRKAGGYRAKHFHNGLKNGKGLTVHQRRDFRQGKISSQR